ncbi:MAG: restriction endonuclease subunit S, partial [Acholeplasmataceae bacterium]
TGKKLITSKHLKEYSLDFDSAYLISQDDYEKINSRSKVEQYDLLYSMIGTVGEVYLEKSKRIDYAVKNVGIFKVGNELDSKWLYYYLKSPKANEYLLSHLSGSTQQYITLDSLRKFPVPKVEDGIRKEIVNILSSLDDKIELNNKINKNLEELAQTLYKHWFVDFEFPNEEGLPYKSSGGKMVESELGLIPEGWNIEPLGNSKISKLVTSGINEFNNEKIYLATADVTDTTITNRNTTITMKDKPSRANMQPRENTLWFAKMKNSRKLIRVSKNSTELISDYIFSTGFAGLYVKEYLNFVWTFLLTSSFDENKNGLASGTTQEAINNRNINKINLIVPKDRILNKFEKIFNDIYEKIEQNDNENIKLRNIRDLLLPKLMSGEIRVPIKE